MGNRPEGTATLEDTANPIRGQETHRTNLIITGCHFGCATGQAEQPRFRSGCTARSCEGDQAPDAPGNPAALRRHASALACQGSRNREPCQLTTRFQAAGVAAGSSLEYLVAEQAFSFSAGRRDSLRSLPVAHVIAEIASTLFSPRHGRAIERVSQQVFPCDSKAKTK